MLKSVKSNKGTKSIVKEFKKSQGNFKSQSISVSLDKMCFESINKINELSGIPVINENKRIVTRKEINTFDFILAILANEEIEELTLTSYRIGRKTTLMLKELLSNNKIEKLMILISSNFPKFAPEVWNNLQTLIHTEIKLESNHTKIMLIKTKLNKYVIEGSGNLSVNARIEQYSFSNNKEIYDFHYNWIKNI